MNKVKIIALSRFREKFGEKNTITFSKDATVLSILHTFTDIVPDARVELFDGSTLRGHVILIYNHERIDSGDAGVIFVSDGDEIVICPPVSGG